MKVLVPNAMFHEASVRLELMYIVGYYQINNQDSANLFSSNLMLKNTSLLLLGAF